VLAQRIIAICDWPECRRRARAIILLRMRPALSGLQHPIALTPMKLFLPKAWSWAWSSEKIRDTGFLQAAHTCARAKGIRQHGR
jgi:hypothetical protein